MRIIWDCSILSMYPVAQPGFRGGTENMIEQLCKRLAAKGHIVHLVCRDAEQEEQRAPNLWYWPTKYHPTKADVVIQTQQLVQEQLANYEATKLLLVHTGCVPYLGPKGNWADGIDGWPVFSHTQKRMLLEQKPQIPEGKVYVVGLGVDLAYYDIPIAKVPGRMFYANDPMRGLFYVLDIFDIVRKVVPEASLHIAYDFDRQMAVHLWEHSYKAQLVLEMKHRLEHTPGVVNVGALSQHDLIREQMECQVHCMPSDPPNIGTQTHGITQMECAAAGAALVLSDIEAFPEVFGAGAVILPVIGHFDGEVLQRRINANDYAEAVIALMQDPVKWQEASDKSRRLAEYHTWDRTADNWDKMLTAVMNGQPAHMINETDYMNVYQNDYSPTQVPLVDEADMRLQWMISPIGPQDDVLDMGCHKGELTIHARKRTTGRVVGIDLCEPALHEASSFYKDLKVEWFLGWAESTGMESESFDVVMIGELLEHVIDPEKLLAEAERLLRPGGRVVISVPKNAIEMETSGEKNRMKEPGKTPQLRPQFHIREYDLAAHLADKDNLRLADAFDKECGFSWYLGIYDVRKGALVG